MTFGDVQKAVWVCDTCRSLIYAEDKNEHLDWHNRIEMREYL